MKMLGEQRIAAPRQAVWAALNDPEVLRRCIPGCQSLEKLGDDRFEATVEIRIGPIGARFLGAVTLSELDPPCGYTIAGQGQGGTVGSAKGGARVRLAEDGGGTRLSYEVDAEVGGRLAQLGGPIIDATAKQLAGRFFQTFGALVDAPAAAADAGAIPLGVTGAAPPLARGALPVAARSSRAGAAGSSVLWIAAILYAAAVGVLVGRGGYGTPYWVALAFALLIAAVVAARRADGADAAGGAPVVMLDPAQFERLLATLKR